MVAEHDDVQRHCWDGAVPIRFILSPSEVSASQSPSPLYLPIRRMSYFSSLAARIRDHFFSWASTAHDEWWLEFEGIPLQWNYPVGVLFDVHCGSIASRPNLPWDIVVHFARFPGDRILRCGDPRVALSYFTNSLKEVGCIFPE